MYFAWCSLRRFEATVPGGRRICVRELRDVYRLGLRTLLRAGCGFNRWIETIAAAASILFLRYANLAGCDYARAIARASHWVSVLCSDSASQFGLASKIQFGGAHPLVSALAFNAGAELAFAAALAVLIPSIQLLARFTRLEPVERIVPSVLAAHTAWHWMMERWDRLALFRLQWPVIDTVFLAAVLRWLMILVLLVGGSRYIFGLVRSKAERRRHVA